MKVQTDQSLGLKIEQKASCLKSEIKDSKKVQNARFRLRRHVLSGQKPKNAFTNSIGGCSKEEKGWLLVAADVVCNQVGC